MTFTFISILQNDLKKLKNYQKTLFIKKNIKPNDEKVREIKKQHIHGSNVHKSLCYKNVLIKDYKGLNA